MSVLQVTLLDSGEKEENGPPSLLLQSLPLSLHGGLQRWVIDSECEFSYSLFSMSVSWFVLTCTIFGGIFAKNNYCSLQHNYLGYTTDVQTANDWVILVNRVLMMLVLSVDNVNPVIWCIDARFYKMFNFFTYT